MPLACDGHCSTGSLLGWVVGCSELERVLARHAIITIASGVIESEMKLYLFASAVRVTESTSGWLASLPAYTPHLSRTDAMYTFWSRSS